MPHLKEKGTKKGEKKKAEAALKYAGQINKGEIISEESASDSYIKHPINTPEKTDKLQWILQLLKKLETKETAISRKMLPILQW